MLYPEAIVRPRLFWNPGDSDPLPLTIDNDERDQPDSAQISFEYLAAGMDLADFYPNGIIARDNTPENNGGYSRLVLLGSGSVRVVLECNVPFADADKDGDVDHVDFAVFQRCISPEYGDYYTLDPICECFDRPESSGKTHGDYDVDQADFDRFLECVSGPAIPADPACDD